MSGLTGRRKKQQNSVKMDSLSHLAQENFREDFENLFSNTVTIVTLLKKYSQFIHDIAQENDGLVSNVWRNDKQWIKKSAERMNFLQIMQHFIDNGCDINEDDGNGLPLIIAMETFDEELVEIFLKHKANPNQFGIQENMNSLAFAIILDSIELTELLLSYGAHVNEPCCNGITPLQLSVNKQQEISKILFKYGASPQQVMCVHPGHSSVHLSEKPLFTVMKNKNLYLMSVMLDHGEDVDQLISDHFESPIHFAVRDGEVEFIKLLIHHGANLNKRNKDGITPLGLAFIDGNKEHIARILLRAGASTTQESFMSDCFDFYVGNVSSRISPLHIAAHYGYLDSVKFIVENIWTSDESLPLNQESLQEACDICQLPYNCLDKSENSIIQNCSVDVNAESSLGTTALFHAFLGGHCSVIDYLLSKGANPNICCSEGNLIHAAIDCYNTTTINLLNLALHFDCDLNLVNAFGYSPLLSASRLHNPDILELLITNGADLDTQDKNGETALMCSVYFGQEENASVLISHGADLNKADKRGTTALYWSIYNCREKTLRLLIEAGVKFNLKELFKYPRNLKVMRNEVLRSWIHEQLASPLSLQQLCRLSIRRHFKCLANGKSILNKISLLHLPVKLKCYLSMK